MSATQPNVLFLLSDQHSFRHLGCRDADDGGEPVQTPALDRLAHSSARFDTAYCPAPLCTPSRLSILAGREAKRAGAWSNTSVLPPELPTLPGTFSEEGYETCLMGKMHLGGDRQFVGFDRRPYGDITGHMSHQGEPPNPAVESQQSIDWKGLLTEVGKTNIPESLLQEQNIVQESLSFLREHRPRNENQPWFLCASFSRPHWPRTAPGRHVDRYWPDDVPEPKVTDEADTYDHPVVESVASKVESRAITDEQRRRARAAYFACVDYLDEIIESFLAQLERNGFLENTIVIYASDHGETAGEHGLWDKMTWHESSTRVPLFVQTPEHRSGECEPSSIETPVSLLDLFPTLCGLTDVDKPGGLDGVDLSSTVRTGAKPQSRPIFVDGFFFRQNHAHDYRMVRDGDYKYVQFRDAPNLLFDLGADPLETENLLGRDDIDDEIKQVHNRLRRIVEKSIDFEEITAARERDATLKEEHRLGTPTGGPNQYEFPDGRVVDADTPLYHPHVITDSPSVAFSDYPETDDD